MGLFNLLHTTLRCPRCEQTAEMEAEITFGYTRQLDYHLGEVYAWVPRRQPQNGGRPVDGNLHGEGYVECPRCQKNFFVIVHICADVITGIDVDAHRAGYTLDE